MLAVKGEPFWKEQNVPASLNYCGSAISEAFTTRRVLFFNRYQNIACFSKGRLCSSVQVLLSADRKEFCGEICGKVSPVTFLEPEMGVKNERPLLFCPFFFPLPK